MCESGGREDVEHLLVMCGEFEWDRWVLSDKVSRIVGDGGWRVAGEIRKRVKEVKVALLLGEVWRE